MKIYFIRHGIAEDYSTDDFHRQLTVEGKIKCNSAFSKFSERIPRLTNYRIYSSPLIRAVETTQILSRALSRPYSVEDFMAGCSTKELLGQLEEQMDYILVGHEPYISMWIQELTGKFVAVSRGSIHAVEILDGKGKYLGQ